MPQEPRGTAATAPQEQLGADHWPTQLVRTLALDGQPRLVFQPIIDLARGVVSGYEALARFDVQPYQPPDLWFEAASRHGHSAALEARVVDQAIDQLAELPTNTFLTINLDPDQAGDRAVHAAFASTERLDGLFVEVTERHAIDGDHVLQSQLAALRDRGAMIALDDVGAGYAGLQAILRLRPHLVKLDRSLITHIDVDVARRAVVQRIGRLADDLDAWVLAEGVERLQELETLLSLGVPLGQGWLLGQPGGEFVTDVPQQVVDAVANHRRHARDGRSIGRLVVTPSTTSSAVTRDLALSLLGDAATPCVIGVDEHHRPISVLTRQRAVDGLDAVADPMVVKATDPVEAVARRAMVRPPDRRWSPVAVTDDHGRLTGVVLVEHLVTALTDGA